MPTNNNKRRTRRTRRTRHQRTHHQRSGSHSRVVQSNLAHNQDGAVLLIGLVNIVLITGLMYFLFGIGETIRHHERMNDAADAGAYATAVIQAHGLNLVALGNMVKLTVTSILAVHLVIAGAIATAAALGSKAATEPTTQAGTIAAALALLTAGFGVSGSPESEFDARASDIVVAIDDLQAAVREELPSIALGHANRLVSTHYQEPAFALRSAPDLLLELPSAPIAPGSAIDLCDRGLPYITTLVTTEPEFEAAGQQEVYDQCVVNGIEPYEMTDPQLGGEAFQIRVAVNGHSIPALGERGVKIAAWGANDSSSSGLVDQRDLQSVWSIAQAEYYFNGPQDENEMLWHMEWRARLRRVHFNGGAGDLGAHVNLPLGEVLR